MAIDVLRVTAGQDHGARFGLRGSEATIGRGPVMDIVLSDPRVSRRHARVRTDGARLMVEDLASSGGTAVNGVTIGEPTALALGDRIVLGETELTVAWTPTGSLPPPTPPERRPAIPPAPAGPEPAAPQTTAAPMARPGLLLPIACIALAAFSALAVWMPALGDRSGTSSIWSLHPAGLRVQALGAALLAGLAASLWAVAVDGRRAMAPAPLLATATAAAGGFVAGLPLFLAAIDHRGGGVEAGTVLLALAGVAIAGCALAGLLRETRGPLRGPPDAGAVLLLGAGGVTGSLTATVASPLDWISDGDLTVRGLGADGLAAGGWLIPLTLAGAAACGLCAAVARRGDLRTATGLAAAGAALTAAALSFATTAAIVLRAYRMEIGLSLVLVGTAVAFVSTASGAGAFALRATRPR